CGQTPSAHATDQTQLVLIAEDEGPIAEALGDIAEAAGYQVVLARDGRHALQCAREQWPALVISEYMMPCMNGVELMATLRARTRSSLGWRHR
ncbi:MAG TPA: response regulator, partial [Ktedonobacterales bacterium]|nr:response regulator [Ktedonobacterales bacterium]